MGAGKPRRGDRLERHQFKSFPSFRSYYTDVTCTGVPFDLSVLFNSHVLVRPNTPDIALGRNLAALLNLKILSQVHHNPCPVSPTRTRHGARGKERKRSNGFSYVLQLSLCESHPA